MKKSAKAAIFLDAENLTQWIKHNGPKKLLDELNSDEPVLVRKAYARWTNPNLADFQLSLNQLGFDLVHTYHPVSKKNSADMQLAVDAMQFASDETARTIVLATGDADFSPLFRRLREMGKNIIGVGKRSPLSESVKNSCSRFIYTDDVVKPASKTTTPKTTTPKTTTAKTNTAKPTTPKPTIAKPTTAKPPGRSLALLHRALERLTIPADCSQLKKKMLELDHEFDHKQYGYSQFTKFLRAVPNVVVSRQGTSWAVSRKSDKVNTSRQTPANCQ